jgi:hypothetical protein
MKPTPAPIRFARFVMDGTTPEHRPELGPCLQWTGSLKTRWGYGQFYYQGRNRSAHAAAWEMEHGPIESGMTLDHLCRNTSCVRTAHMEVVTRRENFRRAVAARTHCPNGHSYASTGSYPRKDGRRQCKECARRNSREYYRANVSLAAQGRSDSRIKYDQDALFQITERIDRGELGVTVGARALGCSPKYLDKVMTKKRRGRWPRTGRS